MNIGSAPTICGSSIEGPSVVGVSATGFGLRPPPFTDTPTTDSHLDCRYARILLVAAHSMPILRTTLALAPQRARSKGGLRDPDNGKAMTFRTDGSQSALHKMDVSLQGRATSGRFKQPQRAMLASDAAATIT